MNTRTVPLRHLADVRVSNVDKKETADEIRVRLVNYTDVYYGDRIVPELELMTTTASKSQVKAFKLKAGDVLMTKDSESASDIGVPAFVERTATDMVCGYHLAILRPRSSRIDGRFLYWAMNSDDIRGQMGSAATGITRFGLRRDVINQVKIRLPSDAVQHAIANYLDTETTRIDALISKKRRIIELLEERKRLLAEDAIALLRNSESLVPLKHLVCESDLRYHSGSEPMMLSVSIHRGVVSRGKLTDGLPRPEDVRGYKKCHPGDIVINRMRAFQGGLGVVSQAGVVSPDYTVLKIGARLSSHFLHYVMRSSWFVSEMTRRLRGIGATDQGQVRTPRINFSDLGLIGVPVPPRWKQDDLAIHLANEETRLTQAIDLLAKQVVLLAERRQTMITAVITGQVHVAAAKVTVP